MNPAIKGDNPNIKPFFTTNPFSFDDTIKLTTKILNNSGSQFLVEKTKISTDYYYTLVKWQGSKDLFIELYLRNNKPDGMYYLYLPGYLKMIEANFFKGKLNGIFKSFHPNKKLQLYKMFQKGVENGVEITFYDSGKIKSEKFFKNGKPFGKALFWAPTGYLKKKNIYQNGKLTSSEYIPNNNSYCISKKCIPIDKCKCTINSFLKNIKGLGNLASLALSLKQRAASDPANLIVNEIKNKSQ